MTSSPLSSKSGRTAAGADARDAAHEPDDLSFAEGADFREIARRIAEFRRTRPDPAEASAPSPARRIVRPAASQAPEREAAGPRLDATRRRAEWDEDWSTYPEPEEPAAEETAEPGFDAWAAEAHAALAEPGSRDDAPGDPRWANVDWPPGSAEGRPWASPRARRAEPQPPADASLRQRLTALRARTGANAASAIGTPDAPVASAAPLPTAVGHAGPQTATAEVIEDWAFEDESLAEPAASENGTARGNDLSPESLIAALDAHLAESGADLEADTSEFEEAFSLDDDHAAALAAAEEDRRLALETATRSEDLSRETAERIDALLERIDRIESQDLAGSLSALAERFDALDSRLDGIAAAAATPVDFAPVMEPLDSAETRLASLETSIGEQHAALTRMLGEMSGAIADVPRMAERMIGFESHLQELALRLETHELNVRAMNALADAMERLEAKLSRPRPEPQPVEIPAASHPASAETAPRAAAEEAPTDETDAPARSQALSEREAILERYRRQSRPRD